LSLSIYVLTQELIQSIQDLSDATSNLIEAITLNINAGGPVVQIGEIISLSVRVLAQVAYTAALIVALVKLAQQFFELIFPKVRYFKACKVKELISKGCEFLGYQFESSLLDQIPGLTILPLPLVKCKRSIFDYIQNDLDFAFTKGYPTAQDSGSLLGQLIRDIEIQFNARTRIINGVVYIERRDFWQNVTQNSIVPALAIQSDRQDEYILNTDEVWKRYYIHYQLDYADSHTLDFFDPTAAEFSTEPNSITNADLVSIKGLQDVNIPYALGVRKNRLNFIENLFKIFAEIIDGLTLGATNLVGKINNRVGVLQVSQQFYSVTKMLYLVNDKQPTNYVELISAAKLWDNYHYINQIQLNDFQVRSDVRTRISSQDFVSLLTNNFAEVDGEVVEILRIEWIDEKSFCLISYKKPFNYSNDKVNTIEIDVSTGIDVITGDCGN